MPNTDLLIIGAGPAGLMAACWASQFNISTRIIDQKPGRTRTGHADGIHSRTSEILDSFGLVDQILRQAVIETEMCYWACANESGEIQRVKKTSVQLENLSRFEQILLNQGLIEDVLVRYISDIGRVKIEWNKKAEMLDVSTANEAEYPVTVSVKDLHDSSNQTETIRARYIVACDGSHSWTREQLHIPMETRSDESTWSVIDIAPITNFPDIRQSCAIKSQKNGSIMTAPRENRLLRLYIQLKGDDELEQIARQKSHESPKALVRIAERAMKPYYFRYRHCDWWSIYNVGLPGQRLVKHHRIHDRIFLAGDAAHTHSPMAGQGMNISMQDTYNLLWKLGSIIIGAANPAILDTYESERRPVARTLMQVDKRVLQAYEQADPKSEGVDKVREQFAGFMSGTGVVYQPSILVGESDADLCLNRAGMEKVKVGMRLACFKKMVKNQADGSTKYLLSLLRSTGIWRLLVFAGDVRQEEQLMKLDEFSNSSLVTKFLNRLGLSIECLLIHNTPRDPIDVFDIPEIFRPFDDTFGWDYGRIFTDYEDSTYPSNGAISTDGEERGKGISEFVILCRPDQHVSWLGALDNLHGLERMIAMIFDR
ncbi:monooxygenase, putative [Talaromyces stipitatus ATCC 10500]|uniref:Monooxygenase, putative n=1 Tax=Talaromyces stipitatus (strain ATCC 10500 / CBS 375.48 / QM 6759 / NRRL 1006) TaxID=441959 RepID=B8LYY0_TALSN|nr:monooxygenase, putative [Talaromyces stipitatus ATCC 10500]EED23488.1 monooxygenase, putative [Talaromyces stipitatus ATCC 10500]